MIEEFVNSLGMRYRLIIEPGKKLVLMEYVDCFDVFGGGVNEAYEVKGQRKELLRKLTQAIYSNHRAPGLHYASQLTLFEAGALAVLMRISQEGIDVSAYAFDLMYLEYAWRVERTRAMDKAYTEAKERIVAIRKRGRQREQPLAAAMHSKPTKRKAREL